MSRSRRSWWRRSWPLTCRANGQGLRLLTPHPCRQVPFPTARHKTLLLSQVCRWGRSATCLCWLRFIFRLQTSGALACGGLPSVFWAYSYAVGSTDLLIYHNIGLFHHRIASPMDFPNDLSLSVWIHVVLSEVGVERFLQQRLFCADVGHEMLTCWNIRDQASLCTWISGWSILQQLLSCAEGCCGVLRSTRVHWCRSWAGCLQGRQESGDWGVARNCDVPICRHTSFTHPNPESLQCARPCKHQASCANPSQRTSQGSTYSKSALQSETASIAAPSMTDPAK